MLKTDLQTFEAPQNEKVSEYVVQRYDEKCEQWDYVSTADFLDSAYMLASDLRQADGRRYRVLHVSVVSVTEVE